MDQGIKATNAQSTFSGKREATLKKESVCLEMCLINPDLKYLKNIWNLEIMQEYGWYILSMSHKGEIHPVILWENVLS